MDTNKKMIKVAKILYCYYQEKAGSRYFKWVLAFLRVITDLEREEQDIVAPAFFQWFSDNWPVDLDWPSDIERPEPRKEAA